MLKPSEELFKFPQRLYDAIEMEQEAYIKGITSAPPERKLNDYAVGWKRVFIDDIDDWEESFSRGRTIEDVNKHGCDLTIVTIKGQDFICNWDIKTFEKEYDKHAKKLLKQSKTFRKNNSWKR